jgi:nucleoside-diphosphate-sugar epimerase
MVMESIALFGASGMTGRQLLPLALEQGYRVKALVRTPSKVQTQHENLTIVQGDFSNTKAVQETVAGADYVICCAGGAVKLKEYPKDMMLNFVSTLVPMLEAESSVKVFVYQAGAVSPTPDGKLPFTIRIIRPLLTRLIGVVPNVLDNDAAIRYLGKNNKPSSFQVIVTRPGHLVDKDDGKNVVASDSPELKAITFKALAVFTLQAIKDESLYGKYPYCAISKA